MVGQDPAQQCGAVRRDGNDVLRCGRPAGHPKDAGHGDWVKIGEVLTADGPTGRVLDALWQHVSQQDGDAWQAPDTGSRSVRPDEDMPTGVEAVGYGLTGRGDRPGQQINIEIHQPRGEGMSASFQEISAIAGAIKEQIEQARGLMEQANNIMAAQEHNAARLLVGSSQEAAQAITYRVRGAQMSLDDALTNSGVALDQLDSLII